MMLEFGYVMKGKCNCWREHK